MKTNPVKLLFASIIFFSVSFSASAQIYVKVRPAAPVVVVTPQPTIMHIWIGEEWEPYGTNYRYAGGHWGLPPHEGDMWKRGHWKRHRNMGHEWVKGNWKNKGRRK